MKEKKVWIKSKLKFFRKNKFLLLIVFVFSLLYFLTIAREHINFCDSDEILFIGLRGGVMHPPGYSLLVFLVFIFSKIVYFLKPAFGINILAGIIQVFNLCLIFLIIKVLTNKKDKIIDLLIFLIVCSLGLNNIFWLQANFLEKYSLALTLILVCDYLFLKFCKLSSFFKYFWGIIIGLGFLYHEIFFLCFLPILFSSYKKIKVKNKSFRKILFGIFTGTIFSIIVLIVFNQTELEFSYNFENNFFGLVKHLGRSSTIQGIGIKDHNFRNIFDAFKNLFIKYCQSSLFIYLPLLILGVINFNKKYKIVFWQFILSGIIFLSFIGFVKFSPNQADEYLFQKYMVERFYIFFVSFSTFFVYLAVLKIYQKFKNKKVFYSVFLIYLFLLLIINYKKVDLSKFILASKLSKKTLDELPRGSIFMCGSDFACFGTAYEKEINNFRKDVLIVFDNFRFNHNFLKKNNYYDFEYKNNPEFFIDFIANKINNWNIFVSDLNPNYYNLLGITDGLVFAKSFENSLLITKDLDKNYVKKENLEFFIDENNNFYDDYIKALMAKRLALSGFVSQQNGENNEALTYFFKSKNIYPYEKYDYIESAIKTVDEIEINKYYSGENKNISWEQLYIKAFNNFVRSDYQMAKQYILGAMLLNPESQMIKNLSLQIENEKN